MGVAEGKHSQYPEKTKPLSSSPTSPSTREIRLTAFPLPLTPPRLLLQFV